MAILVPSWLDFSWQARLQMRLKFCMVEVTNRMGSPSVQYNFSRNCMVRLRLPIQFATLTIQNFRHICIRTCPLESNHLGTNIVIPFPSFTFRSWFLSQIV